jgi:hypothetical protein
MIRAQKAAFKYFSVVKQMPILDSLLKRNPVLNYLGFIKQSIFLTFGRHTVKERAALLAQDPNASTKVDTLYPDVLARFSAPKKSIRTS